MFNVIFSGLKVLIKVLTQYEFFGGVIKSYFILRKIRKAIKKNGDSDGIMNIAKHAIKEINTGKDIEIVIRQLNEDETIYRELTATKDGDTVSLELGDNNIAYNLKTKKIEWPKFGKLL